MIQQINPMQFREQRVEQEPLRQHNKKRKIQNHEDSNSGIKKAARIGAKMLYDIKVSFLETKPILDHYAAYVMGSAFFMGAPSPFGQVLSAGTACIGFYRSFEVFKQQDIDAKNRILVDEQAEIIEEKDDEISNLKQQVESLKKENELLRKVQIYVD